MAAELLLVNPRRAKRRRKASASGGRRRRRRITVMSRNPRRHRRMSALQRKFFGGGKRRRKSRAISFARNPIRRRRRRHGLSVFRRNPSALSNPIGYAQNMIVPALSGAAGGLMIDYAFNNFSALANLSPMMANVAKLGLAALLGYGVGKVAGRATGQAVAAGAITITVYDIVSQYMSGTAIGQNFGLGRYSSMSRFIPMNGMGGHRTMSGNGMGWVNPARVGPMGRFVNA